MDDEDEFNFDFIPPKDKSIQESYIHWYHTHFQTKHGKIGKIYTEEMETDFTSDEVVRQKMRACCNCCNPYYICYKDLKKIRKYRIKMQGIFENTYCNIRWVDLPGGQDLIAGDKNYLMHYIWFITHLTNEVDATIKDTAKHIRYRFEDLLVQAETLGIMLKEFFEPLRKVAESRPMLEEIGKAIKSLKKLEWMPSERKILRLPHKPETTIFAGRKEEFSQLMIYVRRDCKEWSKFQNLPEPDKVDIVTKGLMEISENLKEMKDTLKVPLEGLKDANKRGCLNCSSCRRPTFIPHLKHLKKVMEKTARSKDDSSFDLHKDYHKRKNLEAFLEEAISHSEYLMRYGELLAEEIWDIILMVRLCYTYIKESTHNNLTVARYEAVLLSKFKPKQRKKLLKPSHFKVEDFYKVDCSHTLRKLPIVINLINTELCLHLYGHRNISRKKTQGSGQHKSILKRFNLGMDGSSPNMDTKEEGTALQFVTESD